MKKKVLLLLSVVSVLGFIPTASQAANEPDLRMPDQSFLDAPSTQFGTWSDLPGGLASRPYVTKLSVFNAGVETKVLENGTASTPVLPAGTITVAISPTNLCKSGQTPGNSCYATPNRMGLVVGYQNGLGQLGYSFSNPKVQLLTPVNADTEFDITLALNTLGKTLRWTWANGSPTQWSIKDIGTDSALLRIRFKPVLTPVASNSGGCSQVPVMACEYTTASANYLGANLVMSLDTTLDEVFTGALFASTRSWMGSMQTVSTQGGGDTGGGDTGGGTGSRGVRSAAVTVGQGQLSYGVSAPLTWSDGSSNASSFSAVLSDATLLNFFGATSDVVGTPEFQDLALNLSRSDGGTQGKPLWTRWSADVQGTDGWLITIPDIKFVAALSTAGVRAAAPKVAPATVIMKTMTKVPTVTVTVSGKTAVVGMRSTVKACKTSVCRMVINLIVSKTGQKASKLATVALNKSSTVSATARLTGGKVKRNSRLSVAVQKKVANRWLYVTSTVVTVR